MTDESTQLDATPAVEITLSRHDAARLHSVLEMYTTVLHMAFTNRTELAPVAYPLIDAHNTEQLLETIRSNSRVVHVTPAQIETADLVPTPGGGHLDPTRKYTVAHQLGIWHRSTEGVFPRWTWVTTHVSDMTPGEFRRFDVPQETATETEIRRHRLHLMNEHGKILRERFGYK